MAQNLPPNTLHFGPEPIVFVGEPRRCVGLIRVQNRHAHAVTLNELRLRTEAPIAAGGCSERGRIDVALSATVCAHATQELRVSLRMQPGTPPGSYEAELTPAEGRCVPVSIHVLECRRLRLSPASFSVSHEAGATFNVRFSAQNLGNVALDIPTRAALELHDGELDWTDHFHGAARAHGDEGHNAFLDAFVKKLAHAEPPLGRAKIVKGAGMLAAQESRVIEAELALPKKLHNGRTYQAIVKIADAQLFMTLHVSGERETPNVPG